MLNINETLPSFQTLHRRECKLKSSTLQQITTYFIMNAYGSRWNAKRNSKRLSDGWAKAKSVIESFGPISPVKKKKKIEKADDSRQGLLYQFQQAVYQAHLIRHNWLSTSRSTIKIFLDDAHKEAYFDVTEVRSEYGSTIIALCLNTGQTTDDAIKKEFSSTNKIIKLLLKSNHSPDLSKGSMLKLLKPWTSYETESELIIVNPFWLELIQRQYPTEFKETKEFIWSCSCITNCDLKPSKCIPDYKIM